MTKDQDPIANRVNQVSSNQGEHDRLDQTHGLQVTPERGIEEKRQQAPGQCLEKRHGLAEYFGMNPPGIHPRNAQPNQGHQRRRQNEIQVNSMEQRAMTLFKISCSKGVGDQSVQTQQQTHSKDGHGKEQNTPNADSSNGLGADTTNHHGIDNSHGHPTQFGHDHWPGQRQHGSEFLS